MPTFPHRSRRFRRVGWAHLVLAIVGLPVADAKAPENDDFVSRRALPAGIPDFGSTSEATTEPGEPDHGLGHGQRSIWWTWTAPTDDTWLLIGAARDHYHAADIYTGLRLDELKPVSAAPVEVSDGRRALRFKTVTRMAYQFALTSAAEHSSSYNLEIVRMAANDSLAGAVRLNRPDITVMATNILATFEPDEPLPRVRGSLWWRWFAPQPGLLQMTPNVDSRGFAQSRVDVFTSKLFQPLAMDDLSTLVPIYSNRLYSVGQDQLYYFIRSATPTNRPPGDVGFHLEFRPVEPLSGDWFPPDVHPNPTSFRTWFNQTNFMFDGADAGQSSAVEVGQTSDLQIQVIGPGNLSFWWKVSCNPTNAQLSWQSSNRETWPFHDNPTPNAEARPNNLLTYKPISGEVDWHPREFRLGPGTNILTWRYWKYAEPSSGADAGWVDRIEYRPDPVLPFKLNVNGFQPGLTASFSERRYFRLQRSVDLTNWSDFQTLVPQPGIQSLAEPGIKGPGAVFYRLVTP
ncbi:MAG TPA: hypothetical protein PLX89_27400 [Verrucomicrobiota bacterium]|nr:hypothetical protein [Verrucomicrobiota bacterium]